MQVLRNYSEKELRAWGRGLMEAGMLDPRFQDSKPFFFLELPRSALQVQCEVQWCVLLYPKPEQCHLPRTLPVGERRWLKGL